MSQTIAYTPNAFWWLQYRLLGGPGRLISFCGAYAALLTAAAIGCRYLFTGIPLTFYCDGAIEVLTVIQLLLVIPGGCNAVFRALSRDITSRMIESHRLTPCSNAAVVLGYIVGPNLQILLMYSIGMVVGAVIIRWGTTPGFGSWLAGNVYLLLVAPMAWAGTVLLGIGQRKPVNPNTILFVMVMFSAALLTAPGFGLLGGVYAGYLAFAMMTSSSNVTFDFAAAVPLVVTATMAIIWARAAMRKFRRPDLPAFGTYRALGLYIIWLAAGAVGMLVPQAMNWQQPGLSSSDKTFIPYCLMLTSAVALVVAVLPLLAASHERCRAARVSAELEEKAARRVGGGPMLCAALLILFLAPHVLPFDAAGLWCSLIAVWAAFIALEGLLFRDASGTGRRTRFLVIMYMIFFWGVPPLADLWYGELRTTTAVASLTEVVRPTMIFGLSPVGTIAALLFKFDFDPLPGIGFQLAVAAIAWGTGRLVLRRVRRSREAMATLDNR